MLLVLQGQRSLVQPLYLPTYSPAHAYRNPPHTTQLSYPLLFLAQAGLLIDYYSAMYSLFLAV